MIKYKKNLFIHDYFQNYGGGERLILDQIKKEDDLLTSFAEKNIKKKIKTKKIIFLQNNQKNILIKKILTPILFSLTKVKKEYDNYFISGNYSVFCRFPKNSNKIFYCHSLPKIFFNYKNFYNNRNISIRILIFILGYIFKFLYIKRLIILKKL